jgi:Spy/CpxP family protein refolding chaperone
MKPISMIAAALITSLLPLAGAAQDHSHGSTPYAGFQNRAIKSLSEQDIAELRQGAGWGLALPAELSGWPGPKHLLELQEELDLTEGQIAEIEAIFQAMRDEAMQAGDRFIAAEAAVSDGFADPDLTEAQLRVLLEASASARADLRFIHLSRHLQTVKHLTRHQVMQYNILRGYADDPCASVPEGHNPEMWRKHNGCE